MTRDTGRYLDRITQNPAIVAGKPDVRDTRIPVERVLAHLADNPDVLDLFRAFPRLALDDVRACLEFAREAVERVQGTGAPGEIPTARA